MHFYYSGLYPYCHLSSPNYKFSEAVDSMSWDMVKQALSYYPRLLSKVLSKE